MSRTSKNCRRRTVRWVQAVGALFLSVTTSGCEGLLDVDLPGNLTVEDLNDVNLARTFVNTAEASFDCMFPNYLYSIGTWATDWYVAVNSGPLISASTRGIIYVDAPQTTCTSALQVWLPINIGRVEAENAVERIRSFGEGEVAGADFLIGKALAYAGYNYVLAAEAYCELAWDEGPIVSREATFQIAIDRFTEALDYVSRVTSGPDAEEARSIRNMAYVGRARANLNLGNDAAVLADAMAVDSGFVRVAHASDANSRLYNKVYLQNNQSLAVSVPPQYHNLTVDGVPDPRVPLEHYGVGLGFDGITDMWGQLKYTSLSSPMPFSTWREALLMIAEVQGGQEAVDIINRLRNTWGLPHFSSNDPEEIAEQVREERRRELWLQGTRIGDKLRWNEPWASGLTQRGEPYQNNTCVPLPTQERLGNPNI